MGKRKLGAGYRERKDGIIESRFCVNGRRYSVYGSNFEDCKAEELKIRQQIAEHSYKENKNITLEQYFKEWTEGRRGVVKDSTAYTDTRRFNKIKTTLGSRKIADIERREIIRLQHELSKDVSTGETNAIISVLHSILKSAVCDEIITRNPCDNIKALSRTEIPAAETIHRALTKEEQETFFKYAAASWYYEFFAFLIQTGCRSGEAGALTWRDIDYKDNVIHITKTLTRVADNGFTIGTPKTKTSKRDIPLTEGVKTVLKTQREKMEAVFGRKVVNISGLVFTTMKGKYVLPYTTGKIIDYILSKAAADGMKIEHFSGHAFRDTFATRAIEQGMSPQTLKTILGHSSLAMTMDLYAHVLPDTKAAEMSNIIIAI